MTKKLLLLTIMFLSFMLTDLVAQTTVTLQPGPSDGKDARVHSNVPDNNSPNDDRFMAIAWTWSGTPGVGRTALEFDLSFIPVGAKITSAKLSLYSHPKNKHSKRSGENSAWLQRITSSWQENTLTWNNQPSTTTVNQVSLAASTSETQNYENIDVSALVQDMVNDPSRGHGFMFRLKNEAYYRAMYFCTSDHSNPALRPKLVVTYIGGTSKGNQKVDEPSTELKKEGNEVQAELVSNDGKAVVYPNPVRQKNSITVHTSLKGSVKAQIFDDKGAVVLNNIRLDESGELDISNLRSGVHHVLLNNEKGSETIRFVVIK